MIVRCCALMTFMHSLVNGKWVVLGGKKSIWFGQDSLTATQHTVFPQHTISWLFFHGPPHDAGSRLRVSISCFMAFRSYQSSITYLICRQSLSIQRVRTRQSPSLCRRLSSQDSRLADFGRTIETDYAEIRAKYREQPSLPNLSRYC